MRVACALAALACLSLGAFLAWHHVLFPALALAAFVAWSGAVLWRPWLWQIGVPAALPVVALAPWTGVLVTEEWDLVVLGAAAGAYAARALRERAGDGIADGERVTFGQAWWKVLVLFVVSALVALYRGVLDAGTPTLSWTAGYYDTLNSLRVEKALALALLMAPLLAHALRVDGERAWRRLFAGLALAGAITALVVVWERVAFPGFLNFSTDYRVTGPFWEMHVGGAALDGFLALTLPFMVFVLLRARRPLVVAAGIAGVALIVYAGLVTFSRGVYLALPLSLVVLALLVRVRPGGGHAPPTLAGAARTLTLGGALALASYLAFEAAGYRGLGAALGTFAIAVPALDVPAHRGRDWALALALGAAVAAVAWGIGALVPKGPYLMYAAAAAACAALAWRAHRGTPYARAPALAAAVWLVAMAIAVSVGWAGVGALPAAALAVALFVAIALWIARAPLFARRPRWQAHALCVGAAVVLASVIAVFSGGAYMGGRLASASTDFDERMHHWRDGIGMLDGAGDWLLGKGAGRFPENYLFHVRDAVFPGSYRLDTGGDKPFLTLSGPRYPTSFGDLFRVSQRVPARPGRYVLAFSARAPQDVRLHVEICEKHLLYTAGCGITLVAVRGAPGEWQRVTAPFDARAVTGGAWYEQRPAYFSLAVETSARSLDLADLSLTGPDGRDVLVNGDFGRGMARWFFSSDRYHLPWHAKSLPLNVLYDQGAIGLALFALLVLGALARLVFGRARAHPAAPFLAAALCGFLVVGAFDSLTDVPRVAFAFWLVLLLSALIDGPAAGGAARVSDTRR